MSRSMDDGYAVTSEPRFTRSTFNVSENHKTTFNASFLVPFYWRYCYPDQITRCRTHAYVRISNPLDYPLMDNLYVTVQWWDVPIRNIWTNARKFFGERENPGDSIDYTVPVVSSGTTTNFTGDAVYQRLADHLGVPHLSSVDSNDLSALPFRTYNKIYNYAYRDTGIQDEVADNVGDGPDSGSGDYAILQRGKRFDYFTSGTVAPQRGDSVSIGGEVATAAAVGSDVGIFTTSDDTFRLLDANATNVDVSGTGTFAETNKMYPNTTIAELRNAVAIQQFLERDNRTGQLFGDIIRAHFGSNFNDSKYGVTYLGGGRAPLTITPVYNQAANSTESADLGDFGAIGQGAFSGASFTYRHEEWSVIMGIISIDADLTYHQGLARQWSYRTRYDFMWSEFAGTGDQPVYTKEIYYQNNATDDVVFSYVPRYEECRTGINRLSREFRSDYSTSLDAFHVAQDFVGAPTLNTTFIKASVPMGRVVKNSSVDHFLADIRTDIQVTLPLPRYGVPGLARL